MLSLPALYPITDASRPEPLADQVRRLGEAGFPVVQFRGKPLSVSDQYDQLKRALEEAAARGGWPLIVLNDRPDLALVLASEGLPLWGLHLGQSDLPHRLAVQLPGLEGIHFGASTHGPADWDAVAPPVDHAGVGPFRVTSTKTDHAAPIGLEGLRAGCAALRARHVAPVAIGGLTLEDAEACFHAGAASLAMVGEVHRAEDPAALGWQIQRLRWKAQPPLRPGQGVVWVGASGAGKSTLGAALAQHLGVPFIDLDARIESRLGMSIADYFRTSGEAAFRALERETLPECLAVPSVVALGAGAWQQPEVRSTVNASGFAALWLAESPAQAWSRVGGDPARPLAQQEADYMARCRARIRAWAELPPVIPFGRSADDLAKSILGA